ncbi:Fanconi anemia group A protein-like [Acanthaster planci]|uniref:Fanconi anemia group A protein-like n=1 Tax=Acanthaster planci TaxID=133434 RepID=A0A8B7Z4B3_ACAPL|nr:Fanconi anemia group A protein-like [Acanthaster planci]
MERNVFSLINRHQNFEALLKEASDEVFCPENSTQASSETSGSSLATVIDNRSPNLSIDACLSCIQAQSHLSGTPVPTVAAIECAKELCRLLQATQCIDSDEQKRSVKCLIAILRILAGRLLLHRTLFVEQLASKVETLPLELLWQLHACSAVPLDRYLELSLARPAALETFARNLSDLCLRVDESDECSEIKKDFLEVLLRCGYSKSEEGIDIEPRLAVACQDILDKIVLELLRAQNQTSESTQDHHVAKMFETVRRHPNIDKDAISRFFRKQLQSLLCWKPECDVTTALTKQHDHWTYFKAPSSETKMFIQLLVTSEEKQICSVLREVVEREKVNWQLTLILVSVFCVCFRQGSGLLKALIADLLKESLEGSQLLLLHSAFLLARQAATEGSCDFRSYSRWFQDQFSTASGPHVTSSKTFAFFMEFLNSLVPHEPVHCLKAHVKHPPYAPPKSREVLQDYISLAKTRIIDFKESWQTSGGTGAGTSGKAQTGNQLALDDVEVAVAHYEKTGRIHEKVLQLSIFGRPYYIGQFLPALLTPRMLPDIPDSKMKLIGALKSDDKIPVSMYNKYTEACTTEIETLLEGVSSEDMDDTAAEPLNRLQDSLDSLPQLLMKDSTNTPDYADVAGHMALISERLSTVLQELKIMPANANSIEGASTVILDVNVNTVMEPALMQVTDLLVSSFCKAHLLMAKAKRPFTAVAESYASMLAAQGSLHAVLYHRLHTLICHQGNVLEEDHINSLASLLVHLSALGERLPPVKLQTHSKQRLRQQQDGEPDQLPLLNLIARKIPLSTGDTMKFALKFFAAVLTCASDLPQSSQDQVVPEVLKKKFCYLRPRLDQAYNPDFVLTSRHSGGVLPTGTQPVVSGDKSADAVGKLLSNQDQMTFEEWLHQELRVHLCEDCLNQTQRKKYYHWAVYSVYLPQLIPSPSQENLRAAYRRASSDILNALLDRYAEPVAKIGEHCPHGVLPGQGVERACRCSNSCQEVVQILQELLLVWSPVVPQSTSPSATHCSWLLTEFAARLELLSKARTETGVGNQWCELAAGAEVSNQIMLAQSLPPYLLLTDCLRNPPKPAALQHLINYINTHLRECSQEGFGILSYEVVAVVLQGVLQLHSYSSQVDPAWLKNIVLMVDSLLHECPVFALSVLHHWDMLNPLISQLNATSTDQPRPLASLNLWHKLVHAACTTTSGAFYMSANKIQEDTCIMVVVSSAVQLFQRSVSTEELTNIERKLIQALGEIFKREEIRRYLFECHAAHSAWLLLTHPAESSRIEAHCRAAGSLLNQQPSCLGDCTGDTVLRRHVLQQSVTSLYPVVCFRILRSGQCKALLQQVSTDPEQLATVVGLYTSLVHLHCQTRWPISDSPGQAATMTAGQQILDLEFVHSCFALVCQLVANSSLRTLSSVNAQISAGTDPEVRSMIAQRFQQR